MPSKKPLPGFVLSVMVLLVLCYVYQVVNGAEQTWGRYAGVAEQISDGQWWRLWTASLFHAGPVHIGVNLISLWFLGRALEPEFGSWRTAAICLASSVAGVAGSVLIHPSSMVVGASTMGYGLLGALTVTAYRNKVGVWKSGVGPMLAINIWITFVVPGISIGGHLGGLLAGAAVAWRAWSAHPWQSWALTAAVIALSTAAAVAL